MEKMIRILLHIFSTTIWCRRLNNQQMIVTSNCSPGNDYISLLKKEFITFHRKWREEDRRCRNP